MIYTKHSLSIKNIMFFTSSVLIIYASNIHYASYTLFFTYKQLQGQSQGIVLKVAYDWVKFHLKGCFLVLVA